MKPKIITISGPTAVGKTGLARNLAPLVNGVIVACDSRQVYRGMDIGTGKDKSNLGIDLVNPTQSFSVMNYVTYVAPLLDDLLNRGYTPIITAGTGLYLKSLFNPPPTGNIHPNAKLRLELNSLSVAQLQHRLIQLNPGKWQSMNHSDRCNPRRLIRAIEVSPISAPSIANPVDHFNRLSIGLTAPLLVIDTRINQRVLDRATPQFTREVRHLLKIFPHFTALPAANATGYLEWMNFIQGKLTRTEAIALWQLHERQYARRQLTWFKKQDDIHWFDIGSPKFPASVVRKVQTWYS